MRLDLEPPAHPGRDALSAFFFMEDDPGAAARVEEHLLAGCIPCILESYELIREVRRRTRPRLRLTTTRGSGRGLSRWLRRESRRAERQGVLVQAERRMAPELRDRLRVLTWREQVETVRTKRTFRLYGLAELLTDEARLEVRVDVTRALQAARLAVEVADELDPAAYPPGLATDAQARAWAALGNVRRVRGELREADRAFTLARSHLAVGGARDPLERADLLSLLGSLRRDQGRFGDALRVLEEAAGLFREAGDRSGQAVAVVQLGIAAGEGGDADAAVQYLAHVLKLLDPDADERLFATACQARIHWLTEAGRAWEALQLFRAHRDRLRRAFAGQRHALHLPWLGAKIDQGLNRPERAVEGYESARRGFWEREDYHYFVVVSLDLAVLHLEQGRTEEVRRLAEEMLPVFGSCDIPKEAMQALALFLQAAATETVSAAAVRELTTRLRRAPRTVESADSPDPD